MAEPDIPTAPDPGPTDPDAGPPGLDPLETVRAEFPILERATYLNSCSLGALSFRAERRLAEFRQQWHDMGASAWYEEWMGTIEDLRGRVASFLGCGWGELALLPSTSAALSVVAESAEAGERNRIVCTELDFPTLAYQWAVKPGCELVVLESEDGIGIRPEQFRDAVDERTLFLATSHAFFTTGFVQDVRALGAIAREAGAYCLIDGYQAAGQIPVDVRDAEVDFYTAGPLKWLCGGPGLAYLYVREELIGGLRPRITSWFATKGQFDFDLRAFEYRDDARRFELGTPALPTVHTALGGQEIVDELGIERIRDRNVELTDRLLAGCGDAGFDLTVAAEPEQRSAIVMVRHPDPAGAVAHLADHRVIVDHRPGHVRVSPHFYNTPEEIDRFVEVLAAFPR